MITWVYTLIAISMLIMWLSLNEEDDDEGGPGMMVPAYAPNK